MSSSSHLFDTISIPRSQDFKGPFGRMFRNLEVWEPTAANETTALTQMSQFASSAMAENPRNTVLDNPALPAGYTYFGQFVDHDITFDPTSSVIRANDPNKLHNFRTPRLDLDCLYGEGPDDEPFMYDKKHGGMFLIGNVVIVEQGGSVSNSPEPDLPRNVQGTALIGDKRNDENTIVSQFQLSMLRLHNAIYGQLIGQDPNNLTTDFSIDKMKFEEAQRILRWFYQYVVWNDYVKRIVLKDIWDSVVQIKNGRVTYGGHFYSWKHQPFIPVEFAVSAYRFGHSLIRPGYQVNLNTDVGLGFGVNVPIFAAPGTGPDLRGFRPLPARHTMQWDWFFDMVSPAGFPQASRLIDPQLSSSVSHVPDDRGGTNALAFLNLRRSWRMEMPTGTAVADAMGLSPHPIADHHENTLWHYILKEARLLPAPQTGRKLGPVGSTIVAEVIGGLLHGDPNGYLRHKPVWTPADEPTLLALLPGGPENGSDYEVADLLRAAGAPINDTDVSNTIATGHN